MEHCSSIFYHYSYNWSMATQDFEGSWSKILVRVTPCCGENIAHQLCLPIGARRADSKHHQAFYADSSSYNNGSEEESPVCPMVGNSCSNILFRHLVSFYNSEVLQILMLYEVWINSMGTGLVKGLESNDSRGHLLPWSWLNLTRRLLR